MERGLASWYGPEFAGLPTANGETFDPDGVSAAHRTLPFGTILAVTNEKTGKTLDVRVNDRGPFVAGRILDLSRGAARALGTIADGVVPVSLRVVALGDGARVRRAAPIEDESPSSSSWAVQAGAFGRRGNAEDLRDRLAGRYPAAWLEEFQGLLRVKVGPYATRREAEEAAASLTEFGVAGIVVPHR